MDPLNYYITTFTTAFKNIAPILAFVVGGYFIFIKMPFLFLRKSMDDQKKKLDEDNKGLVKSEKYTVEDYKEFQRKMKLMNAASEEKISSTKNVLEGPAFKREQKQEPRQEQKKQEQKKTEQKKTEQQKTGPQKPQETSKTQTPEEIFSMRPGESFTQSELKKRYFELLKQNHPDRVASMGQDFKKLAEKNTKDINKAFETLKKKAS